jgi:hypothetical protein
MADRGQSVFGCGGDRTVDKTTLSTRYQLFIFSVFHGSCNVLASHGNVTGPFRLSYPASPLPEAYTSSGNLGVDEEMVERIASNLPSVSEGSEVRLTERDVTDSLSSPFLRAKMFGKNDGIAGCPVVIDLG